MRNLERSIRVTFGMPKTSTETAHWLKNQEQKNQANNKFKSSF